MTNIKKQNPNPASIPMKTVSLPLFCFSLLALLIAPARAGVEVIASKSLTIQPGGPRPGQEGTKYFNIEGKDNEKYASFGVLVFEIPGGVANAKVKGMTLTLTQSIPQFAKDGAIKIFLAPELDAAAELKFDATAPDGVGARIRPLHALGRSAFKKLETGKIESHSLAVDDAVRERIAKGGKLCLVIVPADPTVAATYFGANENAKEQSPKLTFEGP
jgi:hypothetical protein